MFVLGIDLETTGLNTKNDEIIELGAVVWDTLENRPVAMLNHLVLQEAKQPLEERITKITGIKNSDLLTFGVSEKSALVELLALSSKCEFVVAHNGNKFDKPMLEKALKRYGLELNKPWVDTILDVPYESKTRKLTHVAAEHNFLNPFAHRALFDVLTMLKVCSNYDWQEIINRASSPTVMVIAKVTKEERQLAKDEGFRWNPETYCWYKKLKLCEVDANQFDFKIEVIQ